MLTQQTDDKVAEMDAPPEDVIRQLVQVFKLLADETRIKILFILYQAEEMNVLDLCRRLDQRQPSVSHHLALLRLAGVIDMRRDGKHNYYSLIPERFAEVLHLALGTPPGGPLRVVLDAFELRYAPPEK